MHGGALAPVEQAKLDGRGVGEQAHRAAESVDLPDDLPLGDPTDGRVAAHLTDGVDVDCQQRRPETDPARRQRRLEPGMPGADNENIESIGIVNGESGMR